MLFCGFLSGAGLNQVISKFWDGTQSFLGGEQAAIPHLKEHIQGFHMNPNAIIFISKIGLFRVNYTSKPGAPRTCANICRYNRTVNKPIGIHFVASHLSNFTPLALISCEH